MTVAILPPLNMQRPNTLVVGYAKQDDAKSRYYQTQLLAGDTPYEPPEEAAAQIRFVKPDGHGGWYDVLEDNVTPAVTVNGSTVTMAMAEQALTCPGDVKVDLMFLGAGGAVCSAFSWTLRVEKNVLDDAILEASQDYFNILTEEIAGLIGATSHPPIIDDTTKNWMLWDETTAQYVVSEYSSRGEQGPAVDVSDLVIVSDEQPSAELNLFWITETPPPPVTLWSSTDLNPNAKTNAMTQEVGIDANGKLWTTPNGTGEPGGLTTFEDVDVETTDWVDESASPTYEDYPYRADIVLSGVNSGYLAEVIFALDDAQSGIFAPVCQSYGEANALTGTGGVKIWASEVPGDTVTIPTIATWR